VRLNRIPVPRVDGLAHRDGGRVARVFVGGGGRRVGTTRSANVEDHPRSKLTLPECAILSTNPPKLPMWSLWKRQARRGCLKVMCAKKLRLLKWFRLPRRLVPRNRRISIVALRSRGTRVLINSAIASLVHPFTRLSRMLSTLSMT